MPNYGIEVSQTDESIIVGFDRTYEGEINIIDQKYKTIGSCACENCSLNSLNLGSSHIEVISNKAFRFCYKLKIVLLPNTLRVIDTNAFTNTIIESIFIPASVEVVT